MLTAGFVKGVRHREAPYTILNYTDRAQFAHVWNDVTLACRGLIIDDSGRVVARPFKKFFNHNQTDISREGPVSVTEKIDGSLGILYQLPDGSHHVATRGSFCSEQAVHATEVWEKRYKETFTPNPEWTYLFEIVFPDNRVVVDYKDFDDLVLLGAISIETGLSVPLEQAATNWPGPVVETLSYKSFDAALNAPARQGVEGCVVHFSDTDMRIKIKEESYVRLHQLVTDVSERRVWEALSSNIDIEAAFEGVPDELFEFVRTTKERLKSQFDELTNQVFARTAATCEALGPNFSRQEFAKAVALCSDFELSRSMFAVLDGKDFSAAVWKTLRPAQHERWTFAKTDRM